MDPALENARGLMGQLLQAFPDQDHDAHIQIHVMFMKTPLVSTSPQVMGTFYAHLQEHIAMKARQMVMQEIQGLISQVQLNAQMGAVDPMQAQQKIQEVQQQMQNPAEVEKLVAMQEMQIMQKTLAEITPQGQNAMDDPLVQIRMQELALKQQSEQRKSEMDQADMMMDAARLQQQAATDAARIESSEEIADNRNEVNRERIAVQRQNVLRRG
jgi:hypothetical protein|tara:strand:- start:310 stop:948 length:639 start_codon:yes stop_codon:yes gene_type:complete